MRLREFLALVVGLVVVGGLGYLGYDWLLASTEPAEEDEEVAAGAGEVVDTYLEAWNAGDLATMRDLLTDEAPEDFDRRHEQLVEALEPTDLEVTASGTEEPTDGRAVVGLTVTATPAEAPRPVAWDTTLQLTRNRGVWSVDWSISTIHPELRPTWEFRTETEDPPRRPILAVDGTELASDDARVIGFVPGSMEDPDQVAAAFERALPGTGDLARRELDRGELVDDWFYPVVTVSRATADAAWSVLRRTPGIAEPRTPDEDERRALLDSGFAQHTVGIIAEATAEQLEELAEEGIDAPVGTRVPQFGLEARFDEQLEGSEIFRVGLAEAGGGEMRFTIDEVQADPSTPVETTLDVAVQRAIENALEGVELPAAIVAVDGGDGAIRGTASRPMGGFDRARTGRYPPASTFKTVTLEAALAEGYDLDDELGCPAQAVVGGLSVSNAGDRDLGTVTLGEAFAESCNTTFAQLAAELGPEALSEAAERFGFGIDPLHPLSAFGGSFPEPADTAELAAAAFGQARVEVSPLHLAAMAAAVGDGVWHQPYLLVEDGPGERQPLATGAADRLRTAFRLVVTDGTGDAAEVPDAEVGGKTGTAENDGEDHAWFIGTVDGLGFAVLVEGGGSGGEVAAPIAAVFVSELLRLTSGDVDPADPIEGGLGGGPVADTDGDADPDGDDPDDEADDG